MREYPSLVGNRYGRLTVIEQVESSSRGQRRYRCICDCGGTIIAFAGNLKSGHTTSCGCLKGAHFKTTMKMINGTSLVMSMTEKVESTRSVSGYTGVTPKRDKWHAYITYKGVHYSLGSYWNIDDAVKARARAKELVMADAQGLLDFYTELEKSFPQLPNKRTEPKRKFQYQEWVVNDTPASAATRSDNTSGYPGVNFYNGKWDVKICYQGIRYRIGRFVDIEDAVATRKSAERLLKEDPQRFLDEYKNCPQYHI